MSAEHQVFELEKYHYRILSDIARIGISNKKVITNATNHDIGAKQIGRKLTLLKEKGFVKVIKTEQIGNMRSRKEIKYGLTFKGLIASKKLAKLEDNYLIKKYLKDIGNKEIEKLALAYLESSIEYFLLHNKMRGLGLTNMKNMSDWFFVFDTSFGFSKEDLEKLNGIKRQRDGYLDKLNKMMKIYFKDEKLQDLGQYVKHWYDSVDLLTRGESFRKIIKVVAKKHKNKKGSLLLDKINLVQNENISTDGIDIKIVVDKFEI